MRFGSTFLGMLLVLLQMLNPFLHAHAQGLPSSPGLHAHGVQGGYVADIHTDQLAVQACFKAEPADHWVLGMPTAHRAGEHTGFAPDVAVITSSEFRFSPVETSRSGGSARLWALPLDWSSSDSLPPPALAPPVT